MNIIYLYCVTEKIDGIRALGIHDTEVKIYTHDNICLVYSVLDRKAKLNEENIFSHEKVLEKLLENNITILPFKFGIYVTEKMLKDILEKNYSTFETNIGYLKGRVEVGIRAIWDYDEVKRQIEDKLQSKKLKISNRTIKSYIEEKLKEHRIESSINEFADSEADKIHKNFTDFTIDGKYTTLKTENMFFNGSYLVEREKADEFYQHFKKIESIFPGYKFLYTGTWPPYNFCHIAI